MSSITNVGDDKSKGSGLRAKLRPKLLCLLASVLAQTLLLTQTSQAEPFRPKSDAQILERLPASSDPVMGDLRRMRQALAADPGDLTLALAVARRYLELGRANADPRYYGYTEAALRPWWNQTRPPLEVLLLRATLRQQRHDFAGALRDLTQVLQVQPYHAQAWLTQAVILQVTGDYGRALRSCLPLLRLTNTLVSTACRSNAASLSGRAEKSYHLLHQSLQDNSSASTEERQWALTLLAEIAVRLDWRHVAERHFRAALDLGRRDIYLLNAYADFLLDNDRPGEVRSLLEDETRVDSLLLRLALAEQQLRSSRRELYVDRLEARIGAARRRGDSTHLGHESRFTLHLLSRPTEALNLALENWRQQREPRDARLVLEAALAADDPAAAKPVLDWLSEVGLEDARLARLAQRLAGEAG